MIVSLGLILSKGPSPTGSGVQMVFRKALYAIERKRMSFKGVYLQARCIFLFSVYQGEGNH